MLGVCGCAAFYSLFWFVDRYESGQSHHRLFIELNYATGGWLGVFVFGGGFLYFFPHFVRAIWRSVATSDALSIGSGSVLVHGSFANATKFLWSESKFSLPFEAIQVVKLTTEGEAMSGSMNALSRVTPLASRWIVRQSLKKACLVLNFEEKEGKGRSVKVSAQFIEGGETEPAIFCDSLNAQIAKEMAE